MQIKNNKNYKNYLYTTATSLAVLASLAVAVPAFAQTPPPTTPPSTWGGHMGGRMGMRPAAFGTVSAISGNTITVNGKQGFGTSATTVTYTVDATNATVTKSGAASTVGNIVVGDTVIVSGTVSGTNITATKIFDGKMPMRGGMGGKGEQGNGALSTITGNGEPVVAGTISNISGDTVTITNKSNVTYTIDATNAKITKGSNATAAISDMATGDMVVVQGTVNGTNIAATSIIDQAQPATSGTSGTPAPHKGFFAGIGSFFAHIFGF